MLYARAARALLSDYVAPSASRRVKMRWLRLLRHVSDVADDFTESDRARAIEVLCEVVCLEHAIALTGGGKIVAQGEMRGVVFMDLENLLRAAQLEYMQARGAIDPDEAELERLRARCEMLGAEIHRGFAVREYRDPTSGIRMPETAEEWAALGLPPPDHVHRFEETDGPIDTVSGNGGLLGAEMSFMRPGMQQNAPAQRSWADLVREGQSGEEYRRQLASFADAVRAEFPPTPDLAMHVQGEPPNYSADDLVALGERMAAGIDWADLRHSASVTLETSTDGVGWTRAGHEIAVPSARDYTAMVLASPEERDAGDS